MMDSAFRLRASLIFLGIVLFGESLCFFTSSCTLFESLFFWATEKERKKNSFLGSYFYDVLFRTKTKSLNFDGEED